jgi:glycosyltransferase involved in cell wall biosynthesis
MFNHNLIVHLSSVHPPFDIRIFHKECKTLAQAGYEVVLVVQHDKDEEVDGIRIRALAKPKNRLDRMTRIAWQVYRSATKENAQLYHLHDPELILIGVLLKILGKRVIYDVHEDYSSSLLSRDWIHARFRSSIVRMAAFMERAGAVLFDGIASATPAIAKRFPSSKTIIVLNFPIMDELVQNSFTPYRERRPVVTYLGGISEARGAKEMVLAVGMLPEHLGAQLYLAGNFSPAEMEYDIKKLAGWKRVTFLGWQSRKNVWALLGQAKLGLALLHPTPNHIKSQPNKLFEYMAAGIPVIASNFPLWKEIVEDNGCGLLIDPLDPEAIGEAIQWVLEHPVEAEKMGQRGQAAVRERYNWDHEANKLLAFYQEIIK